MFHHAHTYIASKLYKSEDPLLIIGSILPDIAITKIIAWEGGLHGKRSTDKFSKFISNNSTYNNLLKGVIAHNILDNFTHKDYLGGLGYAYQNNEALVELIAEYYGLEEEAARGKAHNYIESGVDILLLKKYPAIQKKLKNTLTHADKKKLSKLLGNYFKIDKDKFLDALTQFIILFTKYDFTKEKNWILFWGDLEVLLSLKDIGDLKRKKLLNKSVDIVKNTYEDFLSYSLRESWKKIK